MSQVLSANPPPRRAHSAHQDCLAALLHPSASTYQRLGQQRASLWLAYTLVFVGALIGGTIDTLQPLERELTAQSPFDPLLMALIPITALLAMCSLAAFAWCAQLAARWFKGFGQHVQLAYVLAAISAPLLILASILDQVPALRLLLVALYLYWLAQYVVAIRAVNGFSYLKASAAALLALLVLGLLWLAIAFAVGYSGMLLP
jgi:hypothetical protein